MNGPILIGPCYQVTKSSFIDLVVKGNDDFKKQYVISFESHSDLTGVTPTYEQ